MVYQHAESPRPRVGAGMRKAALITAFALSAPCPAATPYEEPPVVYAGDILPASLLQSSSHRVLDDVDLEGPFLRFRVESDLGSYQVTSLALLRERVHEISTLAQAMVQYQRADKEFYDSLRGQLRVSGDTVRDIVTSPLNTASSLVSQLGHNVGRTVAGESGAPKEKTRYWQPSPGDRFADAQQRRLAGQLGLDVYSSNPQVHTFLREVSQAHVTGRDTGLSAVASPHPAGTVVAGGVVGAWARTQIKNLTPAELDAANGQRLAAIGIPDDLVHRFLTDPWFSPRHKTFITAYLQFLEGVEDRAELLRAALSAHSEAEALSYEEAARMLALYHDKIEKLRALGPGYRYPLAVTHSIHILAVTPIDVMWWSRDTDRAIGALGQASQAAGKGGGELIVSGILTDTVKAELKRDGLSERERFGLPPVKAGPAP